MFAAVTKFIGTIIVGLPYTGAVLALCHPLRARTLGSKPQITAGGLSNHPFSPCSYSHDKRKAHIVGPADQTRITPLFPFACFVVVGHLSRQIGIQQGHG